MTYGLIMNFHVFPRWNMNIKNTNSIIVWILLHLGQVLSQEYIVTLSHNGPVVLGAQITFTADLFTKYNVRPKGHVYVYEFKDNALPSHDTTIFYTNKTTVYWNVSYPHNQYSLGRYEAQVEVFVKTSFFIPRASERIEFTLTDTLNGGIKIDQEGISGPSKYVTNAYPVNHTVNLRPPDYEFLSTQASSVLTFWFVDCVYYGFSTDYSFSFNYTEKKSYNVEALVVATFEEPKTTTAPPSTSSTVSPPTTTTSSTSTPTNVSTTEVAVSALKKVEALLLNNANGGTFALSQKGSDTPTFFPAKSNIHNEDLAPYLSLACLNSTFVPPDPNKTYGYFQRQVIAKAPVSNVVVKGNNWLQFGDMLDLNISCNGSAKFFHCAKIKPGVYNVTGNETCASSLEADDCRFALRHYFREPSIYTVIIIISNDVSKVVQQSVIRMYSVTKQPQLSVIVVPVTFSLLAVISIVFGVAYYVQSQNRFTVEVADFDFGQVSEMEYKSFYERLREDISNMFSRSGDVLDQVTAIPERNKYDNMDES